MEDNVEASILREEESLARDEASSPLEVQNYSEDLQKVVQELKTKHEVRWFSFAARFVSHFS